MFEINKNNKEAAEKMEKYRKERGISYTFISNNIFYEVSYVRKCLLGTYQLSENMRKKINELWGTDF